jgi:hypothetical protein
VNGLDKETIKLMIKRMGSQLKSKAKKQLEPSRKSYMGESSEDEAYVTTESFFSKSNSYHPIVSENDKLKKKLNQLSQLKQSTSVSNGGGSV